MNIFLKYILIICFFIGTYQSSCAQNGLIFGTVTEGGGKPVELATIQIKETQKTVESNTNGDFSISVPSKRSLTLRVVRVGFRNLELKIDPLEPNEQRKLNLILQQTEQKTVEIRDKRLRDEQMLRTNIEQFKLLPTATGNLESVLPSIALGTSSGSGGELTSQYQVRGGNYDENLVYVNDFEIYRPQLIRAGQQEGLTFPNPDLVRDLSFSSGGFEARYGDKMSSVLDIKYKRPDSLKGSLAGSFLGGSAHLEGSFKLKKNKNDSVTEGGYRRLRYLVGARYKTTRYLLGTLDVKGEYVPDFYDIQTYITYDISRNWQLGIMANYNASYYNFIPTSRTTATGVVDFAIQIRSAFEGQQRDGFQNGMVGASLTYLPDRKKNPYFLKFLASRYQNRETEGMDIIGKYLLGEVDINLGSSTTGEIVATLGTGTQHNYVRNYLYSTVQNIEHRGGYELQKTAEITNFLQWGAKWQREDIADRINEWERLDSALYSLPFDTTKLLIRNVLKTKNELTSNRFNAYFQDTYSWRRDSVGELQATLGVRATYWDLNGEFNISPRLQVAYKPLNWKRDMSFRLSSGLYVQPPFYRELRRLNGTVNDSVRAQKSAHIVLGWSYDFLMGKRKIPFKLISEVYFKYLWDLNPYDIDNVRIRYYANNDMTGYITGWDLRLNGEFVKGAESWINLSILQAREKIAGITHLRREFGSREATEVANVPRPTDQFMTLAIFFQDYLPKNKNFKMHVQTTVGTGMPFGAPNDNTIYRNPYRLKPYHRVDAGFSWQIWDASRLAKHPKHFLRFSRNAWVSLEAFNLMAVANEASRSWIKTIYNTQFAMPNYLTSRRINFRLRFDF